MRFTAILLAGAFLTWAASAWAGINPAAPGLPSASAYGAEYAGNRASAMCIDCHTANPKHAGGTHFVTHSTGAVVLTTNNTALEKLTAWPSTALSRYASPSPPDAGAQSVTGATGEMICESCHDVVRNVDGGNNLVESFRGNVTALCEGCHASQAGGPQQHHPLTGDMVGPDDESAAAHALVTSHSSHVKAVPTVGSDVGYPAADMVNCASCHNAHGAALGSGARTLRRGYSASGNPLVTGKPVNVITYAGVPMAGDVVGDVKIWSTGDAIPGIGRQFDITTVFGVPYRLVTDQTPLCDACHAP